ncbi:D-methionine transport system substrate-binding protein [Rhizobium sp. RU35A]|uniref:MetQ/NlpA family ABC transporter substrate-binding protein n=1 Tax=Rhizobium straminoryzae TaxID=1387186 RepID=A0A549SV69_9HYPH|nr:MULTISPECIES: MetQ/NlpA family ABC transporter substrate-binding protein [Rhizobium]TRL33448.1 MetQ/NlpA family ABC transporter substrate-binding protein [Rhizobium straminoryzae]SIR30671.1 D-methionine transport system substrate-binding protein [Rhizobium sp. RU35A]
MKLTALLSALLLAVAGPALAETVKIGVVPGVYGDSVAALVPEAKAAGIDLQVIEFSDWTTPNEALQAGDLDLNYFQHVPFLNNAIKQKGYNITPIGVGTLANIGIYSLKHKDFASVPQGATVAIANDPVNQGRGLLLLAKGGLIKLKDGVGFLGTLDDIVDNPKKVTFKEVEGPQLARVTGDVDLALGYPHFIIAAKTFDPGSALIFSGIDDKQFAIVFAANKAKADNPALKKVVELYQTSKTVREAIAKGFANNPKLYTIAWEK